MRRKKDDADKTKAELLDAAQKVFSKRGFSSATLEHIAKEASVTRGAVYHHFREGKGEILNQLCIDRYSRLQLESSNHPEKNNLAILKSMIMAYFNALRDDAQFADLQYILTFKTELSDELLGGMAEKVRANQAIVNQYTDLIFGIGGKKADKKLNSKRMATMILAFQGGLTNLWLMDRSAVDLSRDTEEMVDVLLRKIT